MSQLAMPVMTEPEVVAARKLTGRIIGLFVTADKSAKGFETAQVSSLELDHQGVPGSRHHGWTRGADSRVPYLPRGVPMRNTRALSIVSAEDLAEAARVLDIPRIEAAWIGASILTEGLERLSFLPRGTKLFCDGGAILTVEDQNAPCRGAGAAIATHTPGRAGLDIDFPKYCKRLRGLIVSVEYPASLGAPSAVTAHIPEQWLYR